jgi:protein TonB
MFVESLVESTPLLRSRNRAPAMIAIAAQCALLAILVAIPILHPEVLSTGPMKLSVLAPPPMPAPKPPPLPRPHVETAVATSAPATVSPVLNLIHGILHPTGSAVDEPLPLGSTTMGPSNPALPVSPIGNTPNVVVKPTVNASRPNVSSGVIAGLLLAPIQPIYPTIAKASGTQGIVVIAAIISKTGHIESAHVLSGPVMLQGAALDAVRAARYRPYLLNGEPTEVETTININFRMGS